MNPVQEIDGKQQADGLEIIDHKMPSDHHIFYGLTRSTIKGGGLINCFLDGNPNGGSWHFAIGMYQNSEGDFKSKGIPTYKRYSNSLRLWMKINTREMLFINHNTCKTRKLFVDRMTLLLCAVIC